jgi:quercetin dioxygenase-like cupin family protein
MFEEDRNNENGSDIKINQLVGFVEKIWGHEEWIVNNKKYCGKKLVFKKGFRCSMHCHKIKDETFYLLSGKVLLETEQNDIKKSRLMSAGDIQHIAPETFHRITSITNAEIIEFSTLHMEEDSYRIDLSCQVNLKKLQL